MPIGYEIFVSENIYQATYLLDGIFCDSISREKGCKQVYMQVMVSGSFLGSNYEIKDVCCLYVLSVKLLLMHKEPLTTHYLGIVTGLIQNYSHSIILEQ